LMGERPALSVAKSTLRRVQPTGGHDWHQDGAFLGRDVRSVNVWLALSDCGSTAPGMDVVGSRLPYILQTHSHGAYFDWSVGQGMVDILAEGGAPVLTPEFGPGDALLFDHMMLHRTSVKPGMTGTRWAIESWFFAPTCYPYDQIPLLV
jgi:ectoine hydroxylase-related dioxygenase (phytanoyl-CoA dioxygenase family)